MEALAGSETFVDFRVTIQTFECAAGTNFVASGALRHAGE